MIGPAGIGILGVLNATLNMISGVSKMGLDLSSVKEIASNNSKGNEANLKKTIGSLQKILLITGIIITILTMLFSGWISEISFGTNEYRFFIFWVALALLFKQLTVGNLSILQGLRKLKSLAKANLISSFISVLIVIPCYYYMGIDGIIPVIVLNALSTYLISKIFVVKEKIEVEPQSISSTLSYGKQMMKLGAVLSISTILSLVVAYVLQIYITNVSGVKEVGFFNAGFVIVNTYVGLIFNAMSKDYFPRLSEQIEDNTAISKLVSYQASIALLLLVPIVVIFLSFSPFIIELLYTREFLPVVAFVNFAILGMIFKAVSWTMGYVIIAKGDSRIFIKTAIGFNLLMITLNILGYHFYGLWGLGLSFLCYFVLHLIGMLIITGKAYKLKTESDLTVIFVVGLLLSILAFLLTQLEVSTLKYGLSAVLILFAIWFSYYQLNKRLDFKDLLKGKMNKE